MDSYWKSIFVVHVDVLVAGRAKKQQIVKGVTILDGLPFVVPGAIRSLRLYMSNIGEDPAHLVSPLFLEASMADLAMAGGPAP